MAMKRKRSTGSWEYCIQCKGVLPKPVYLTFRKEAEGDACVARAEALLRKGIVAPELAKTEAQRDTTLADAIRTYRQATVLPASDILLLDAVMARLGRQPLTSVDFAWADAWIASLKRKDKLAPSTIRHYVGALARCLDWFMRRTPNALLANPLRGLPRSYASYSEADAAIAEVAREDVARDRRLSPGEEECIRAVLSGEKPKSKERPPELKHRDALVLLFDLALESAMRLREMFTLGTDQIDLDQRTIFLERTKNGDKRQVPLSTVAVERVGAWLLVVEGRLFPWWDGSREGMRKTTAKLSQQFARVFEAAGCPDLRFHDLRHEATCRLFERTRLTDVQIAKITGHKDPRMLARYANLRGSDLADELW